MNKRTLTLVSCVPSNPTHSSRMSAGAVFHTVQPGLNGANRPQSVANSSVVVSIGSHRLDGNAFGSVHHRSNGLRGYRSLATTGRVLGVSEDQVRQLIDGPLVGRMVDGELLVHDDDLADYLELQRRPRLVAAGA